MPLKPSDICICEIRGLVVITGAFRLAPVTTIPMQIDRNGNTQLSPLPKSNASARLLANVSVSSYRYAANALANA